MTATMASDRNPEDNSTESPSRPTVPGAPAVSAVQDDSIIKAPHLGSTARSTFVDADAESQLDTTTSALALVLKVAGSIVAPTTLLTALLFYFGLLHAHWFFQYFGVNYTIMGLTAQDYLLRSADGLFVPLTVVASAALLMLWGYQLGHDRFSAQTGLKVRRVLVPIIAVTGVVLICVALTGVVTPELLRAYVAVPGLSLAIGVLLLALTFRLWRSSPMTHATERVRRPTPVLAAMEWSAIFVLVSIGLFWSVGDYSAAVGTGRGRDVEAALPTWPDATVYSSQSLGLKAPGVREVPCANSGTYRFRYDGLKLVLQSNDQYFFLPAGWTAADGVAVVIPRNNSLRLEFVAARAAARARSRAC